MFNKLLEKNTTALTVVCSQRQQRISDDFQRVTDLDTDLEGGTGSTAHSPHRHGARQHGGHWGTNKGHRAQFSHGTRMSMKLSDNASAEWNAGLYQLTISVLVAANYAVQVVRTCKRAGAVDDRRLGGNNARKTETISLPQHFKSQRYFNIHRACSFARDLYCSTAGILTALFKR